MRFTFDIDGDRRTRKVAALAAGIAVMPFVLGLRTAHADGMDDLHLASGSVLLTFCAKSSGHTQSACLGYIAGISDAMINDLIGGKDPKVEACIPRSVTVGKRAAAVIGWMNRHTRRMKEPAATLVAIALAEAYPCK